MRSPKETAQLVDEWAPPHGSPGRGTRSKISVQQGHVRKLRHMTQPIPGGITIADKGYDTLAQGVRAQGIRSRYALPLCRVVRET